MGNPAEWHDLVGLHVQILKEGRTIRTGYVEEVTVAGDALWIAADWVQWRALYEKARGDTVLPIDEHDLTDRGHQG